MDEFKSNSHKAKAETQTTIAEKKVEKAIAGSAKIKKKSEISKVKDVFISEDIGKIKSYVLMDVLVPAIKKAIKDIVKNGIDMILDGGTRGNDGSSIGASYVAYDRFGGGTRASSVRAVTSFDFDNILLTSRSDAKVVLEKMDEVLARYGTVSVADMYDAVGFSCPYTYNNYGWDNLRDADIIRVNDGYMIRLPKVIPVK